MLRILEIHPSYAMDEGDGVIVNRIVGSPYIEEVDPVPLFDEFKCRDLDTFKKGFPKHPHRGVEVMTYIKEGSLIQTHESGQHYTLREGDVQWTKAGRGIVHAEVPSDGTRTLWGFEMWLALKKTQKMTPPRLQTFSTRDLPLITLGSVDVRVITGTFNQATSPIETDLPTLVLDVMAETEAVVLLPLVDQGTHLIYVYEGSLQVGGHWVDPRHMAVISSTEPIHLKLRRDTGCIYVSSQAHGEPMVKAGSFVMNTKGEIEEAFRAYRKGQLGGPYDPGTQE